MPSSETTQWRRTALLKNRGESVWHVYASTEARKARAACLQGEVVERNSREDWSDVVRRGMGSLSLFGGSLPGFLPCMRQVIVMTMVSLVPTVGSQDAE